MDGYSTSTASLLPLKRDEMGPVVKVSRRVRAVALTLSRQAGILFAYCVHNAWNCWVFLNFVNYGPAEAQLPVFDTRVFRPLPQSHSQRALPLYPQLSLIHPAR